MLDPVPLLEQGVQREQVARVSVPNVAERLVLPLFHIPVGNRHRDLDVGVGIASSSDEVALELPDTTNAHLIAEASGIAIDDILEDGTAVDAVVGVERIIKAQVSQIVIFLRYDSRLNRRILPQSN